MKKQTYEKSGLIPRSIIRTFGRFKEQLLPGSEKKIIQEFRISRYQVLVSVQTLFLLVFIPFLTNVFLKNVLILPVTEYFWNNLQSEIFINSSQQNRAYNQIQKFEEKLYFEKILTFSNIETFEKPVEELVAPQYQEEMMHLAIQYNQQSIISLTNCFSDIIAILILLLLIYSMKPQIIILKSFLVESLYSLSDTTKSFLLIFFTDLLVGFHSPRGWDVVLEIFLQHFGLPENQDFILLFVATFPVLLDTVFKYWIFRYLNKISPSTVATYHNMIE
jgi:hypothetical protein